jgi:hypothetical protein
MHLVKRGRGRPPKFGRPSRPVTVTLPEDVIARLSAIDADLGQAIVSVLERHPKNARVSRRSAELANYGANAVIVVIPVRALKQLPGVQLVPIGQNRALISLDRPYSVARLELDVRDVLVREGVKGVERQTLEAIADILRRARLSKTVRLEERTIIVLESKRRSKVLRQSPGERGFSRARTPGANSRLP